MPVLENVAGDTDTFSMFFYVCFLAPVFEEILFRGLILRQLEPYGKKFAILASAFLFGMFHGNLVQTPYAFVAGLVLGYVAIEYNVIWAMVLHMINNLLLGDTLARLTGSLPELAQQIIFAVVIWGFAIAALVILICQRKKIAAYFRSEQNHPLCMRSFFTAPGILALTVLMIVNMLLPFLLQLI
jgi:membrane protease YdiL (CAAX protease family)